MCYLFQIRDGWKNSLNQNIEGDSPCSLRKVLLLRISYLVYPLHMGFQEKIWAVIFHQDNLKD
jgi:hypothetical protein